MIENLPSKYGTYKKKIEDFVWGGIVAYYNHDCFKILKNKIAKLNDSIDMRFNTGNNTNNRIQNAWRSNIAYPMVREGFLQQRATLSAAFRTPPLFTILPDGYTPFQNAKNMQDILITTTRVNQFRETTLNAVFNSCSRYGCATVMSYFNSIAKKSMKTMGIFTNGNFTGYDRVAREKIRKGVYSECFDIKDYFQQPDQPNPYKARYRGYVERIPLHQLQNEAKEDPEFYIKENIGKIIKEAEKGSIKSEHYHNRETDEAAQIIYVDRYHWFGTLDFKDNRDDDNSYYVQMVDGKVIAIDYNPNDEDLVPIDIYQLDPRPEYWWGTTQAENVIPMENTLQLIFSMVVDSGIQELQKFIFYDTGTGIDISRVNEAAKNGGLIGYDRKAGMPSIKDIFWQPTFQGVNPHTMGFVVNEMKGAAQRVVSKGDFSHKLNEGGYKDTTATVSNIIDRQGNTLEAYYLEQFSYGLISNIRTMATILKQRLGHEILARPNPSQDPIMITKLEMLGDYTPIVISSITQNQINRAQRLFNMITAVQNFKGSGDPTWLNFNLSPVIREWSKDILERSVDVDQVYPEITPEQNQMMMMQQQMAKMGVMPGPGMGTPQQGAIANVA